MITALHGFYKLDASSPECVLMRTLHDPTVTTEVEDRTCEVFFREGQLLGFIVYHNQLKGSCLNLESIRVLDGSPQDVDNWLFQRALQVAGELAAHGIATSPGSSLSPVPLRRSEEVTAWSLSPSEVRRTRASIVVDVVRKRKREEPFDRARST